MVDLVKFRAFEIYKNYFPYQQHIQSESSRLSNSFLHLIGGMDSASLLFDGNLVAGLEFSLPILSLSSNLQKTERIWFKNVHFGFLLA